MKIKKTIAAIAAAAMVFTSLPMIAFAVKGEGGSGVGGGDVSTPVGGDEDDGDDGGDVETGNGLTAVGTATINNETISGTGTATVTTAEGNINVAVTLTPTAGDIGGQPQEGDASAQKNYHITIPISGLTGGDEGWALVTGPDNQGGQYGFDDNEHKDWNVAEGNLKLWLPAGNDECKVVLKKGDKYQVVIIKTTVAAAPVIIPPEPEPEPEPEAPAPSSSSSSSSSESSSSGGSSSAPATTVASTPAEVRSATKPNVTVDAAATKVTPAMVKAFTKNSKTKTMTLDYGKNVMVAIAKDDVKDAAKATLDFSVSGKKFISDKAIKSNKTLSKAAAVAQVDFVQEGKFNGIDKVTVKNRVGGKYAGQKATVYEYVNGKLVKVAVTKVGGSGLVSFKIDHFGQYVIVVDAPAKGVTKAPAKADEK